MKAIYFILLFCISNVLWGQGVCDSLGRLQSIAKWSQAWTPNTEQPNELDATFEPYLDSIAQALKTDYPDHLVLVEVHSSSKGNHFSNVAWTEQQAAAIQKKLKQSGIAEDKILAQGWGEYKLLYPECNPASNCPNSLNELNQRLVIRPLFCDEKYLVEDLNAVGSKIEFEPEKPIIKTNSYPLLDAVVEVLNKHSNYSFLVEGHLDKPTPSDYSLALSTRQADAVVKYLADHGIAKERLRAVGKEDAEPIVPCDSLNNCSAAEIELNRRIEFVQVAPSMEDLIALFPELKFEEGEMELSSHHKEKLDFIYQLIVPYENYSFIVEGLYYDSISLGDEQYKRAQERAQNVVQYLVDKGIQKERLRPVSGGQGHCDLPECWNYTNEEKMQRYNSVIFIPGDIRQDRINREEILPPEISPMKQYEEEN